jgi:Kef-type K+ transport system membrane component KefB
MSTTEVFLLAMLIIFTVPYLIWRVGRTDYYAPLVVVQIIAGILLGPGVLGAAFPDYYRFIFTPQVIQSLNGIAWWAVMIFVMIAGVELDLVKAWEHRRESTITAAMALGTPLLFGCVAAIGMLSYDGWIGPKGQTWQFIVGVGMACAVTALPILILLMEKLDILRQPIGQRILRYASLDDIAIWGVLALILLDWTRVGRQIGFLVVFTVTAWAFRKIMMRIEERDRWYAGLIWLALCGFAADWAGLHYMVGAFLAGAVMDAHWFDQKKMDLMRHHVLMAIMPVFFLSTGLRTNWAVGGSMVFIAAAVLLAASVSGKLIGIRIAGRILKWEKGEASIIGWLLQTKALIMIIFVNILLDKGIITSETFTALLLMAIGSTMLTVPVVHPKLQRMKGIIMRSAGGGRSSDSIAADAATIQEGG